MAENVIALDIDGPLFSTAVIQYHPDNRQDYPGDVTHHGENIMRYWRMDEMARIFWSHLTSVYDFKVVISSSWRLTYDHPDVYRDLFMVNDLYLPLHGMWRTDDLSERRACTRAKEIQKWIDDNEFTGNVICFDDVWSGASLVDHPNLGDKTVFVDSGSGWSGGAMSEAIRMMQEWK